MYLFGASGHGKVIKEIIEACGGSVIAFVDDNKKVNTCAGLPVLHDANGLSPIIVSIGVCRIRKMVVERLQSIGKHVVFGIALHPSAIVSSSAQIGEETVIMAGAVINADAKIGKHCIINTGATVDHDCVIEDFCHIAPGAHISGGTHIGEGTWIGVGASVIQCLNIGKNCMIGAGSVVVRDIPDNVTAFGNPSSIKNNDMNRNDLTQRGGNRLISNRLSSVIYRRVGYVA